MPVVPEQPLPSCAAIVHALRAALKDSPAYFRLVEIAASGDTQRDPEFGYKLQVHHKGLVSQELIFGVESLPLDRILNVLTRTISAHIKKIERRIDGK